MTSLIIDASVILKWFFKEIYQPEAWSILEENNYSCATPDFALYECAGVIRRKIARKDISASQGCSILHNILSLNDLTIFPAMGVIPQALVISNSLQHDLYDCLYLATAEQNNSIMITADKKFFNKVKISKYSNLIIWIEDTPS